MWYICDIGLLAFLKKSYIGETWNLLMRMCLRFHCVETMAQLLGQLSSKPSIFCSCLHIQSPPPFECFLLFQLSLFLYINFQSKLCYNYITFVWVDCFQGGYQLITNLRNIGPPLRLLDRVICESTKKGWQKEEEEIG